MYNTNKTQYNKYHPWIGKRVKFKMNIDPNYIQEGMLVDVFREGSYDHDSCHIQTDTGGKTTTQVWNIISLTDNNGKNKKYTKKEIASQIEGQTRLDEYKKGEDEYVASVMSGIYERHYEKQEKDSRNTKIIIWVLIGMFIGIPVLVGFLCSLSSLIVFH